MKKEKLNPIAEDKDAIQKLESSRLFFRDLKTSVEAGEATTYEWFEDNIIKREFSKATVEFKKDALGNDSATIKVPNPKTGKDAVLYTINEEEVSRLKSIIKGKAVEIGVSEDDEMEE